MVNCFEKLNLDFLIYAGNMPPSFQDRVENIARLAGYTFTEVMDASKVIKNYYLMNHSEVSLHEYFENNAQFNYMKLNIKTILAVLYAIDRDKG
jgi:hypothetical protein